MTSKNFLRLHSTRRTVLAQVLQEVSSVAQSVAPNVEVRGRLKSLYSTWCKLRRSGFEGTVLDGLGVRVIVPRGRDCYRLVEEIHRTFETVVGEYDDYVRNPKRNGYQSLHTTVVGPRGYTVEVQVRTPRMHERAERGAAAHAQYKREACAGSAHERSSKPSARSANEMRRSQLETRKRCIAQGAPAS